MAVSSSAVSGDHLSSTLYRSDLILHDSVVPSTDIFKEIVQYEYRSSAATNSFSLAICSLKIREAAYQYYHVLCWRRLT